MYSAIEAPSALYTGTPRRASCLLTNPVNAGSKEFRGKLPVLVRTCTNIYTAKPEPNRRAQAGRWITWNHPVPLPRRRSHMSSHSLQLVMCSIPFHNVPNAADAGWSVDETGCSDFPLGMIARCCCRGCCWRRLLPCLYVSLSITALRGVGLNKELMHFHSIHSLVYTTKCAV